MNYGGSATCKQRCDDGYTINGALDKICVPCDVQCATCQESSQNECITCATAYPFQITGSNNCLEECSYGYYASSATACSPCQDPCADCDGGARSCTACFPDGTKPALYLEINDCLEACPIGYAFIAGTCVACQAPCVTCSDSIDFCDSCDGEYSFNGKCYLICPDGTSPDNELMKCIGCLSGCQRCDESNPEDCLLCESGLYVHEGSCVAECPEGYRVNFEQTACTDNKLVDIGIVYFPFLICLFIGTIVSCFGKKAKNHRPIVTIIVIIGPLQFMACILQCVLSFLYSTYTHAIIAGSIAIIIGVTNMFFFFYFSSQFKSAINKEVWRKPKELRTENDFADPEFYKHMTKYKKTNRCITSMTMLCSFKTNKMWYSAFYGHGNFITMFSHRRRYEKMMIAFCIFHMISVDLVLFAVDVAGIGTLTSASSQINQLLITVIETAVLSLLNVILGSWELKNLRDILDAVQESHYKKGLKGLGDAEYDALDQTSKEAYLKTILAKIGKNEDMFLNNTLDDLLKMMGNRRCKSMYELPTGWEKEKPLSIALTCPLAPMFKGDRAAIDKNAREDNVYHDCLPVKYDTGVMPMDFDL